MKKNLLSLVFLTVITFTVGAQTNPSRNTVFFEGKAARHPISLHQTNQVVKVCGLEKGKHYKLYLSTRTESDCSIEFISTSVQKSASGFTEITAVQDCEVFMINTRCDRFPLDAYITVQPIKETPREEDMNRMLPISISSNANAQYLIEDVFIGGGCFDVSNVFRWGDQDQTGTFTNGGTSINLEDGIILSTGSVFNALGPNVGQGTSTGFGNSVFDADLNVLAGGQALFDAASIEFNFTPTVSTISFEYAFASEEYCEYVNSNFNDVFGFFISGPGINGTYSNGGENIAIIPGTGDEVAINSVNHLSNSGFYINNIPIWHCCS